MESSRETERAAAEMVKATGVMSVTADLRHSAEGASPLSSLRGSMFAAIPTMPERFVMGPHPDRPAIIVRDSCDGGREPLIAGLCDSHGVSHALNFLQRVSWKAGAEATELVEHFDSAAGPHITLEHVASGETEQIGLCNLRGARSALRWLNVAVTRLDG